ncbi:MAG: DNA-directed RNA polymerase subunit omega [Fimbriimonadales bacterium]
MLPSPDILNDFEHGKFVLSNLAAKRAKQLREGAPALVRIESTHPLTIALAEIAAGKIKPIYSEAVELPESELVEMSLITDETLPAEFGMLLPALDETEVALVSPLLAEDDHEDVHEVVAPDAISLSDLVADEDEEEIAPAASDDDTLSLSDIAEQETSLDDDEHPEE